MNKIFMPRALGGGERGGGRLVGVVAQGYAGRPVTERWVPR